MKERGIGGGNTITGLNFERTVDFQELLAAKPGYEIKEIPGKAGKGVFFEGELVARCFRKNGFYKYLDENDVDWHAQLSKKLLPDDALLVIVRETLFIIEVKYQQVAGSVDEKLQTCDFKRKQYQKLVVKLGLPEPEHEGEPPIYGVKPGYYDSKQMLHLIDENKGSAQTVQFIADMLETGDPENDGFAEMLRTNCHDPNAIARIVEICKN
jgi:hypothetical protein